MPRNLGVFDQWWGGEWADRNAINANADELAEVEGSLDMLRQSNQQQRQEITRLRAMIMGLVKVLESKGLVDDAAFTAEVNAAYAVITRPPPSAPMPSSPFEQPRGVAAPVSGPMTTCVRCGTAVPLSRTNVTAAGNACERCS